MWRKSSNSSGVKPGAVDMATSKKNVYVRKDFVEVPNIDMDGNETGGTHWEYMENAIPKSEWGSYKATEQNRSDIAYLAMMADVELE